MGYKTPGLPVYLDLKKNTSNYVHTRTGEDKTPSGTGGKEIFPKLVMSPTNPE